MPERSEQSTNLDGPLTIDLLRVARGLEADGEYLRARLFRAAALGLAIQGSPRAPRLGSGLEQLADNTITELAGVEGRTSLAAALRDAMDMRQPPPQGEMAVTVCMRCGEVNLDGSADQPCPACGAGALASRPLFPAPYYDPASTDRILSALQGTPSICSDLCQGMDELAADRGRWPVRDILDHLLGAQRLIWGRAQRMLDEDEPDLGGGVPPPRASDGENRPIPVYQLLRHFAEERNQLLTRVRALKPVEWERGGTAQNGGRTTVRQRLTYLARHEHDHLGDLLESVEEAKH